MRIRLVEEGSGAWHAMMSLARKCDGVARAVCGVQSWARRTRELGHSLVFHLAFAVLTVEELFDTVTLS